MAYVSSDVISKMVDTMLDTTNPCVLCKFFDSCPLMGALETHIVYPSCENICIEDCAMYEPDFNFDEGSLN